MIDLKTNIIVPMYTLFVVVVVVVVVVCLAIGSRTCNKVYIYTVAMDKIKHNVHWERILIRLH